MMGVGWPHRLACATAGATVGLIVAGGLVTNTGAALAVPDWPTTFGHNPFLFPWSGMVGGVLVEHGHRLSGLADRDAHGRVSPPSSGVGDATPVGARARSLGRRTGLCPGPHRRAAGRAPPGRAGHRPRLSGAAVLRPPGGDRRGHGPRWRTRPSCRRGPSRLASLGRLAAAVVYGQMVLGAFTTHGTAVWWHVAGAGDRDGVLVGHGARRPPRRAGGSGPRLVGARREGAGPGSAAPRARRLRRSVHELWRAGRAARRRRPAGPAPGLGALVFGSAVALALQLGRRRALGAPCAPRRGWRRVRTEAMA